MVGLGYLQFARGSSSTMSSPSSSIASHLFSSTASPSSSSTLSSPSYSIARPPFSRRSCFNTYTPIASGPNFLNVQTKTIVDKSFMKSSSCISFPATASPSFPTLTFSFKQSNFFFLHSHRKLPQPMSFSRFYPFPSSPATKMTMSSFGFCPRPLSPTSFEFLPRSSLQTSSGFGLVPLLIFIWENHTLYYLNSCSWFVDGFKVWKPHLNHLL